MRSKLGSLRWPEGKLRGFRSRPTSLTYWGLKDESIDLRAADACPSSESQSHELRAVHVSLTLGNV